MGRTSKTGEELTTMKCERCYIDIERGFTYDLSFYCNECMEILNRANRVSSDWEDAE